MIQNCNICPVNIARIFGIRIQCALFNILGDWTFQPPTIQPPIKADLPRLIYILQRMKFNSLFARALSVESYCLHYVFKLFTHNL